MLDGGGGRDTLLGGANSDVLIDGDASGAADADILDGREGGAEVSYAARTEPVRVDLARSVAGEPGEGDVIRSISGIIGGAGADDLRGDGNVNGLVGGAGDDCGSSDVVGTTSSRAAVAPITWTAARMTIAS